MKASGLVALLVLSFFAAWLSAQQTVAKGECQIQGATPANKPLVKTATRWFLFGNPSGGYRLESEIQNQPAGMRIVQVEELTDNFVPTSIGYQLTRKDETAPSIIATCDFSTKGLTCTGSSGGDLAPTSEIYKVDRPFWMWIEELSALDIPWLFGGALNMARFEKGSATVTTVVVSGGSGVMIGDARNVALLETTGKPVHVVAPSKPIPWSFKSEEQAPIEFVASESLDIGGTKIAVRHYASADKKTLGGMWITDCGIPAKMSIEGGGLRACQLHPVQEAHS